MHLYVSSTLVVIIEKDQSQMVDIYRLLKASQAFFAMFFQRILSVE